MTHRELELLDYMNAYCDDHRVSPSFDEMRIAMGLRSKSSISRMLGRLLEKGLVVRLPLADRNYRPKTTDLSIASTLELRAELDRRNRIKSQNANSQKEAA